MHKISGLNLCIFYSNFYLTKCGGCGIIVNSARIVRARAAKKEGFRPLLRSLNRVSIAFAVALVVQADFVLI